MRSGVTSSTGWLSWVGRNPALWCPEREVGKTPPLAPQLNHATAPRARGLSGRRACALLSVARSTLGYQSRLVDRDAPALAAMRRLVAQYPRYGYRRIRIFLKREGHTMSTDRTHRLWRQAGLQVPRRRPRRRVALSRPRPVPATAVNHVWSLFIPQLIRHPEESRSFKPNGSRAFSRSSLPASHGQSQGLDVYREADGGSRAR